MGSVMAEVTVDVNGAKVVAAITKQPWIPTLRPPVRHGNGAM